MVKVIPLDIARGERHKAKPLSMPTRLWVTNDIRDFAKFWPRSDRLGDARCYAFQCADILELHCDTFIPARKAVPWYVAVVNEKDEPLALFPFMIEQSGRVRVLRFIDGALSDINAPVLFPPTRNWTVATFRTIWRTIRKQLPFDFALFEKVPATVVDLPNPVKPMTTFSQGYSSHQISLSGSWEKLSKRFPRRKELHRKLRRLHQHGNVEFVIAETAEQYDALIAALMRQKSRRDIEAHGGDSLDIPGFRQYLQQARRLVYPSGPVALFGLKIDGNIIAAHWGYIVGSRFYSLIPSFEAGEWYAYSPGFLLADKMFEWCLARNIDIFDYGIGDEAYKEEYCDVSTPLHRAQIPSTIMGRSCLVLRAVKRYFTH